MMKMTVGLGALDDYPVFARAGADEVFCGCVPLSYLENGGLQSPINRREVLNVNVQTGGLSELQILADMAKREDVPITIALNAPYYDPAMYDRIIDTVEAMEEEGIHSFIVADPGLLRRLCRAEKPGRMIHLSGETGEINRYVLEEVRQLGVSRIIFQRKTSPSDMKKLIDGDRGRHPDHPLEFEAFALNELCQFSGSYCNTLHCDEFAPACRIPYRLGGIEGNVETADRDSQMTEPTSQGYLPGRGGCGLCALWKLREAGITHLKLVSRGNYSEDTEMDIQALKYALNILNTSTGEEMYQCRMKAELFPQGCSGDCYYC